MPLAGKRATIINTYRSTTVNNDKQDSKTFKCNIFQGYLNIFYGKNTSFNRNIYGPVRDSNRRPFDWRASITTSTLNRLIICLF